MMRKELESPIAIWIENTIRDFLQSSENSLGADPYEPAWGEPLVGFSRGDDPLYRQFQDDIGPFYLTPEEMYNRTFPERPVPAKHLTVISWVLPQTEATKSEARREFWYPSERWARARKYGEEGNMRLQEHLAGTLQHAGYKALSPSLSPLWALASSEGFGLCSNWSERHAAFAAGLGTFGLCDGLITPVGKAMRCGSVIARVDIPPTQRPYANRNAYCLFFSKGTCGACIRRCPAGAISANGHDKEKCKAYIANATLPYVHSRFGLKTYACGLCQTKVPCESGIPR